MKRALEVVLVLLSVCAARSSAQTNVDRIVSMLDTVAHTMITQWTISPDIKQMPQSPISPAERDFNDAAWKPYKANEHIYVDSCWFHAEFVMPQTMFGRPASGRVRILLTVDDYGFLYVNGAYKGEIPWDGNFELTPDARPGDRFFIAVRVLNTGGPLRLIKAEIAAEATMELRQKVEDFALSLRVGQRLLSFDTYQRSSNRTVDPKIDKTGIPRAERSRLNALLQDAASELDVKALAAGNLQAFLASMDAVRTNIKPVGEFAKKFTLYFTSNAHIDAAWLWRSVETMEVCKRTFGSVMNMMRARPDFTYTQSSAVYYDWMERMYPKLFAEMQQRVKEGRWEISGGMWIEPDCNIPNGDSWSRHLLFADRYFKQKFGVKVKIGWNPDSFGYNWNMPAMYKNAGFDAFITQKIGWNDTNVFPYRLFWWEGPDGTRLLTYFPFDYVNEISSPYSLADWLRQYEANTGFPKLMVLFGVGDHGGGPSLEMLARIDRLQNLDIYPRIEHGTATAYLNWLKEKGLASLPVYKDELYLEYHQGTYTTQAAMKKNNREAELLMTNAENFSSFASLSGRPYDGKAFEEAWKHVMFNQFHDILPGSSIREVYIDAAETEADAKAMARHELTGSLSHIAKQVNTSAVKKGTPVVVFNPIGWERTDRVSVALAPEDMQEYAVFDVQGKEVPSQTIQTGRWQRDVLFIASGVPAFGYKTYELRKQKPSTAAGELSVLMGALENGAFKVVVDTASGWVKSVFDKRNNRELLSGKGNELQLLDDWPREYDAWNIGWTGITFNSTYRGMEVMENGPVRVVLRMKRDYLKPGTRKDFPTEDFPNTFFTQDIILYRGSNRIEFRTGVDWWESKTMLKAAFPLAFTDTIASYEIPYGSITRSTQMRDSWEKAKIEVPAYRWADVTRDGYGVSLLNTAKYGYDIKSNVMRLSLLRSPKSPDPTADRGKHSIEYALYPHTGTWLEGGTVQEAAGYNNPMIAVMTDAHKGKLADTYSFVQITPASMVLTSLKKAEDDASWVIRWYNASSDSVATTLTLPKPALKAVLSNFLEEDGEPVAVKKDKIEVTTPPRAIMTVKVTY